MSLTLPSEGQSNWDDPLNAALTNLDTRVDAAAATAASANSNADSAKQRANHTGTQPASSISDFNSAVDARIAAAGGARSEVLVIAVGDETTAITTGTAKVTFRMPFAFTLTAVRASLTTASTSGLPTFDINEGGASILSTKLTIDANEKTSTTAATPYVFSDTSLADDAEITVDIDVAGTGAKGPKVYLIGVRA